jgi:hypothetical protein
MAKERVQVQGLGDVAPGIQPTIQRAGQYGIQVQRAGRNKLMDLADALGQVNPALQEYGRLQDTQYKLGLEQAALVEEKQEIEQLKNTKDVGFFDPLAMNARNRGVRDGLLKRYISNTMVPNLSAKTDELIDVQKYTEDEDFYAAVDNEIAKEWQGLVNQVGERIANTTASKALWNTVAPRYRAELIGKFEKAKQEFIEDNNGMDLMTQLRQATVSGSIDVVGLELIAEQREKLMVEQGITDPSTRQKILLDGYTAQLDTLITKEKFKDARSFVGAMELMKVNGRRVFGSAQSVKTINDFITTLETAESKQGTVSKTTKQQVFAGLYKETVTGLNGMLRFGGELEANHLSAMRSTLTSLSTDLADDRQQLNTVMDGIIKSSNPVAAYRNKLSELSQSEDAPDLASELYIGNTTRLDAIDKAIFERPTQPINLNDTFKRKEEQEFLEWAEGLDELPTVKGFIESQEKKYAPWDELLQLGVDARENGFVFTTKQFKGVGSDVAKMIKNETELAYPVDIEDVEERQLEETYKGETGREFERSATERIKEELKLAAPKNEAEVNSVLKGLMKEERERWLRIVEARKDLLKMKPEGTVIDGEVDRAEPEKPISKAATKEIETKFIGADVITKYDSLDAIDRGVPLSQMDRAVIEEDRKHMASNNRYHEERRSYYNYGLSRYSPEAVRRLKKIDLDSDDVFLFGGRLEMENKLSEWMDVLIKDLDGKKLTPEDLELQKQYQELGIYDEESFSTFGIIQADLIDRPRRPL